jgi:RHH-type proline utilization regulon transcriptional repressor/proline dehydrogenase/delta 1-pyrroline-5-carboxylate dehydrogenase
VKGAYWDSEIKRAQERGLAGFPVYTRKAATDVAYLACVRRLAAATDVLFPQFATHNAHTVAYVLQILGERPAQFEFQRLHGMGEALYAQLPERHACRVYAPVGAHQDLLPYLVRRLLENGANTSFVNRIVDGSVPADEVVRDPVAWVTSPESGAPDPRIRPPRDLYRPERPNSAGINLASPAQLRELEASCNAFAATQRRAAADAARDSSVAGLFDLAADAQLEWASLEAAERARHLEVAADLMEGRRTELVACCTLEAGRTVADALAEQREAVDLLRYYAARGREAGGPGVELPGVVGEANQLRLRGRGVFVCVSPWNFPLSIFTGQVAAALVMGNTVIAKPAPQTPRCAALVTRLLHEAGVPRAVLQLAPGDAAWGAALLRDERLAGVAFTGSTTTAGRIATALASRGGALLPFIAETGGINAIVADSSALPEQLVQDVLVSAFNSAGQRCSAARLLFVQRDIADRVLELLAGAMDQLVVGDPAHFATDVGPVIDREAWSRLDEYRRALLGRSGGRWHHESPLAAHAGPLAFAPLAVDIDVAAIPRTEVFGPILHVLRFEGPEIDAVIDRVDALGYGLTLGLHTRIEARAAALARRTRVGNVYVNRNIIGAVVGSQPFGGTGLSGTGPKAGGPHYLQRFAWEQAVSTNTAAIGGNASLLAP